MVIKPGQVRELRRNRDANPQVAVFDSGGRGGVADLKTGDAACIPAGHAHAIRDSGSEDLEVVQAWDDGVSEEINLKDRGPTSPRYLVANNVAGVPASATAKMQQA